MSMSKIWRPRGVVALLTTMILVPGGAIAASVALPVSLPGTLPGTLSLNMVYHPADTGPRDLFIVDSGAITLPQFDPALGTLDSIDLLATGDLSYTVQVDGTGVVDPNLPGTIAMSVGYGAAIYVTDPASPYESVYGEQTFTASGHCTRNPGDLSCSGLSSGWAPYDATGSLFPWMGQEFSQFIGTGTVSVAGIDLFLYDAADSFTFDNYLSNPADTADVTVYLDNGAMTVVYNYSPVPLPPALWLLCSGLLTLGWRARLST